MGVVMVDTVVDGLSEAGLRAAAAYPGEKMPQLSAPVVAVGLEKVENGVYTVRAEVLSPAQLGGTACEMYAEEARTALEGLGAVCSQSGIDYDGRTDLFRIPILGLFPAEEAEPPEEPALDLTMKLGQVRLNYITEFTAAQETEDPTAAPLSGCGWTFRIRELFPPGTAESSTPAQPFTMTVSRTGREETYESCYLTSVKRNDAVGGLEQIRTGIAGSMSFIAIV